MAATDSSRIASGLHTGILAALCSSTRGGGCTGPMSRTRRNQALSGRGRLQEVLGEALQHAAGLVDRDFLVAVQAAGHRHFDTLAIPALDDQGQLGARVE